MILVIVSSTSYANFTKHTGYIYTWNRVLFDFAVSTNSRNRTKIFLNLLVVLIEVLLFFPFF